MADSLTKTLKILIDGKIIEANEGANVLEVALASGVQIPHLCHDPDLTPAGRCRLCLVEVEGSKGLQASCELKVQDGLSIKTDSKIIQEGRRAALEMLLATHPGDCLACAKNGSCGLQSAASLIGVDSDRLEQLRVMARRHPLDPQDASNPFFKRDPNLCVLCGICVRTCDELQGVAALTYADRGANTRILVASQCESCGECVVRCPTGAIALKEERKPLAEVKTTCTYCGVGCQVFLGTRGGEVVSTRADRDNAVNEGTLCVKGRFGNEFIHSQDRLTTPLIKRNGQFEKATWDEAFNFIVEKLSRISPHQFAAIGSSRATNEENYLMQKFARSAMGTNNVDNCARLCHAPTMSGLYQSFGTGGGTNPLEDIDTAQCLFVIGSNTTAAHSVAGTRIRRAARNAKLIVADPRRIELADRADLFLALKPGTDVALLMGMAKVILDENLHDPSFVASRTEGFETFAQALTHFDLDRVEALTGVPKASVQEAARLYATHKPGMIIYSLGITEHSHGVDNVMALTNLALLTGNIGSRSAGVMPMRGQNNVQGACDMGCIPNALPGSQYLSKPENLTKFEAHWKTPLSPTNGLTLVEMLQASLTGQIKAFYIMGMDVAFSVSDLKATQKALRQADLVIVQDILMSGTAEFAHVILPAATFAEKDGTFTNLERRVQRVRKAIEPVGESKPDWWIIAEIAKRMGKQGFEFESAEAIWNEMASLTPAFTGLTYDRIEKTGLQWPVPSKEHPGTPRLHTEKFNTPTGKGRFAALEYRPSAEQADRDYPFILTTGRSLYHFHLAMTTQVKGLMALHPEEEVWIHPDDAQKLQLTDRAKVRVSSKRGSLTVKAKITDAVLPGTLFMTFHFYNQPTNILTQQFALDPVSKTPEFKVTAVKLELEALE